MKGTWVRPSAAPELEPDFFSMDSVHENADENSNWNGSSANAISSLVPSSEQVSPGPGETLVPLSSRSEGGIMIDPDFQNLLIQQDFKHIDTHLSSRGPASDCLIAEGNRGDEFSDMFVSSLPLVQSSREDWSYHPTRGSEQADAILRVGRKTSFPHLLRERTCCELNAFLFDLGLASSIGLDL